MRKTLRMAPACQMHRSEPIPHPVAAFVIQAFAGYCKGDSASASRILLHLPLHVHPAVHTHATGEDNMVAKHTNILHGPNVEKGR